MDENTIFEERKNLIKLPLKKIYKNLEIENFIEEKIKGKTNDSKNKVLNKNVCFESSKINYIQKISNFSKINKNIGEKKKCVKFKNILQFKFKLINKNLTQLYKNIVKILFNYILLFFFISIPKENCKLRKLESINLITITFDTTGTRQFLNNNFFPRPDYIWINDQLRYNYTLQNNRNEIRISVDLSESEYKVTIGWNPENSPKSCKEMFSNLNEIIGVDLSKFDSSEVTDMSYMFSNCKNLKSINLDNLNTSSVQNMESMFRSCEKMTNINLLKIDTSSVKDMKAMFFECKSLLSLDLSSFDTSLYFKKICFIMIQLLHPWIYLILKLH